MEIIITQEKTFSGDKYRIFVDGRQTHTAAAKLFRLVSGLELVTNEGDVLLTIKSRFAWFKAKYDIIYPDGHELHFRTESTWKNHYSCEYSSGRYDIYGHKGGKYSVFKDDQQVATWEKERVSWFGGDRYRITCNPNVDQELLVAFCLIIDHYLGYVQGNKMVSIDFGHFGSEARKFDPSWQAQE